MDADGALADRYAADPARWELDDADIVGDVPPGSVQEVLAWAGDDPARRAAALYAEQQGKGRKGVISALSD